MRRRILILTPNFLREFLIFNFKVWKKKFFFLGKFINFFLFRRWGACSEIYIYIILFSFRFVALNNSIWNQPQLCGKCKIWENLILYHFSASFFVFISMQMRFWCSEIRTELKPTKQFGQPTSDLCHIYEHVSFIFDDLEVLRDSRNFPIAQSSPA